MHDTLLLGLSTAFRASAARPREALPVDQAKNPVRATCTAKYAGALRRTIATQRQEWRDRCHAWMRA